ncbi:sterol desaturase family protein [Maribacter flavus]|uniref:Sterol desaturase family protein n=1 Tax=Maribacter flavus TaxID=1658664 RepID=A0A5B2TWP0_9FLAO|nr:sterol desaturase family protein [Maribacter flavus]KAA2218388.1 sterol desaturase family protein [Maribacter flavus]
MEHLIQYFETIPSAHRSLILVGGITFFWVLEGIVPLFTVRYKKWKHAVPNFFFTLTTIVINFFLAFLLLKTADWTVGNDFGILNWLPAMPLWLYVLLGVMLLDLIGAYLAHWVEHKVKPLWMVHLVHHSDHHVDTTTANRHHPLESFVRYLFTLLGVLLVGAPIGIIMLYQSLSVVLSQFNHANIKLPTKLDKYLSYIIVSPDMHKVHHHYVLPYTDSNYGNIFAIWDRLFGTYMYLDRESIVYGVDTFPDERENSSISRLLKQPFHKYRRPTTVGESKSAL